MITQSGLISHSFDDLIRITIENYRQGCKKLIEFTPKISGDHFELFIRYQLESQIKRCLSLTDQLILAWSANIRSQGFMAVRREQFETAEQFFAKARVPFESKKLSLQGSLLHKSFQEPAEAYLDYRRGDFDKARSRIFEALTSDTVLEEKYGYHFLFIHRLNLIKNLIRTEASSMCFERAMELAHQLLSYLKRASDTLPVLGLSGYEPLMCQPPELVTAICNQVTSEVALMLAGKNSQIANKLFAVVSAQIQLKSNDNNHDSRVNDWFVIKQEFVSNNVTSFLEMASPFLAEGRGNIPLLWYATVIDLIMLCDELKFPDYDLLKQEVAKEAINWQYLPSKFFPLLNINPTTMTMLIPQ